MKLQFKIDSENFTENNNQLSEKIRNYNIAQVGAYGKREGLFFGYYRVLPHIRAKLAMRNKVSVSFFL